MELSTTAVDRLMGLAWYKQASTAAVQHVSDRLAHPLRAVIPAALRRWREDQETWDSLRRLDDRQLKEFGICHRPPELVEQKLL
jgi:uncharacterized protein YjiS (DUF1127 family)